MNFFEALFGGGPEISPQHEALRAVRFSIQEIMKQSFATIDSLVPDAPETQVVGVCQWPERECETVYIMGASGNIVRIRIDGAPAESAVEFMKGEPAIEYHSIKMPNDPGDLLKGDQKL